MEFVSGPRRLQARGGRSAETVAAARGCEDIFTRLLAIREVKWGTLSSAALVASGVPGGAEVTVTANIDAKPIFVSLFFLLSTGQIIGAKYPRSVSTQEIPRDCIGHAAGTGKHDP